jgi:hypothetical protein
MRRLVLFASLILCCVGWSSVVEAQESPALDSSAEIFERGRDRHSWGLITSIGVPQPVVLGLEWTQAGVPQISYTGEVGWFAYGFGNQRNLSAWSVQGGIRYRPWNDWVQAGLSFGFRRIGFTANISGFEMDGEPLASSATMGLNTLYFGLLVGGQWHLSPRVSIGIDLGVQLSVFAWGGVDILADPATASDGTDLSVDASDSMRRIASLPLPQIALLRFIWYL